MDALFFVHNQQIEDPANFSDRDPNLRFLHSQRYVYRPDLLEELPTLQPGIYSITGGRQVGKTTLLKQWMLHLLTKGIAPQSMVYFTGESIDNHHQLIQRLKQYMDTMPRDTLKFVLLDEVTYIEDWDKGIKALADAGLLAETVLVLTGSDSIILKEARMRFPGRRGEATHVDFHLYPLSFRQFVGLAENVSDYELIDKDGGNVTEEQLDQVFAAFDSYLVHGGYLTAINDFAKTGAIMPATLQTYADWICGDMLKAGKSEHYLREIIVGIMKRYNSQITWNSLSKDLTIDHPQTVIDYVTHLQNMDALFVQQAIVEDKLLGAPKKARRIMFSDPFIYHALGQWISPKDDPYSDVIQPLLADPTRAAHLVEGCATTLYSRFYPTYYIKAEGEVDIAYVKEKRFWPVEVKWTTQIRSKDIKQISKYKNGLILTRQRNVLMYNGVPAIPLPLALLTIDM